MVKIKESDIQTEEKIFNAATVIFEEKGFAAARMQEIADRAGINKALLHYYFHSKEQLFQAVFQPLMKKMFEKILSVFAADMSFEDKIRMYYDEHINILTKNPRLPLFLLTEISHNPELAKGVSETFQFPKVRDMIYRQHARELREYGIKKSNLSQLMITIISLAIFPFAARDVMKMMVFRPDEGKNFNTFMRERKEFAADFVISALKNHKNYASAKSQLQTPQINNHDAGGGSVIPGKDTPRDKYRSIKIPSAQGKSRIRLRGTNPNEIRQ